MITVTARLLKAPGVVYASIRPVDVRDGSWNLANQRFNKPGEISNWTYVWVSPYPDVKSEPQQVVEQQKAKLDEHVTKFMKFQIELGMTVRARTNAGPTIMAKDSTKIDKMFSFMKQQKGIKWLLVILEENDVPMYSAIKNAGDVKHGIKTVCVTRQKFSGINRGQYNQTGQLQYFGNVSLKFNLKAGGTNNVLLDGKDAPLRFIAENKTMIVSSLTNQFS